MNRVYQRVKIFLIKNYDAIKLGLLAGLLVFNVILLNNQTKTLQEILSLHQQVKVLVDTDNSRREAAREEAKRRDDRIIRFLRCIALIPYGERTEQNFELCVNGFQIVHSAKTAPLPQKADKAPRQEPTTSMPPEPPTQASPSPQPAPQPTPPQPGLVQRMNQGVENLLQSTVDVITNPLGLRR